MKKVIRALLGIPIDLAIMFCTALEMIYDFINGLGEMVTDYTELYKLRRKTTRMFKAHIRILKVQRKRMVQAYVSIPEFKQAWRLRIGKQITEMDLNILVLESKIRELKKPEDTGIPIP